MEITSGEYDYVLRGGNDVSGGVPVLEYEVGTKVQFEPYERSELQFVEHSLVLIDKGVEKWVVMPPEVAGVATQVRRLD